MRADTSTTGQIRNKLGDLATFLFTENSSAKLLALASVVALVWANSPVSGSYETLWTGELPAALTLDGHLPDLRHWVNDGVMVLFFLVVGLEIKREFTVGELSSRERATLPIIAAFGGMVLPALLFTALNAGTPQLRGWGIPMATDIAFALGALALVGPKVPVSLKVFLLSLAIADDLGAIAVIAIFYAKEISGQWLAVTTALIAVMFILQGLGVGRLRIFVPLGLVLWFATLSSGIHPTVAGVALAFAVPTRAKVEPDPSERLERALHPWSGLLVVPLFGLANAGVSFGGGAFSDAITSRLGLGIILGLVVGKVVGIAGATWLGVKLRWGTLSPDISWSQVIGLGAVAGIGFTVSLFIAELSFRETDMGEAARLAILIASVIAATIGVLLLRRSPATEPDRP